jgi:2-amino-4-hydroxy-6-hydroxymethyldihydropteridine diphosphokinase
VSGTRASGAEATAYIGMGANLGDRLATLNDAVDRLSAFGMVRAVSSVYETDPMGMLDQPPFLNAAAGMRTSFPPEQLMAGLLQIERDLGRVRTVRNAPRTIDLDLLLYDGAVIETADLTVPHPALHERAFVLVPLAEIAPHAEHPVLGVSIHELLGRLEPAEGVHRVTGRLSPA